MADLKILGITDDHTNCECCGKSGLKKTVALDKDGVVVYYGTDCAAQALLGKKSSGNRSIVEHKALAINYVRKLIARGYSLRDSAMAMRNKYGYLVEVRGNLLSVGGIGNFEF